MYQRVLPMLGDTTPAAFGFLPGLLGEITSIRGRSFLVALGFANVAKPRSLAHP